MKKIRITSLLLAILMIVSMIPVVALSVFADGEEDTFPPKPERLPGADIRQWEYYFPYDGTVPNGVGVPYAHFDATYTTQMLVDFTKLANDQVISSDPLRPAVCNSTGVQGKNGTRVTLRDGLPEEDAYTWRGASGLLIAVDTKSTAPGEDVVAAGAGWHLRLYAEVTRASIGETESIIEEVMFSSSIFSKPNWYSYYYAWFPEYQEFVCDGKMATIPGTNKSSFEPQTWNCERLHTTNARIVDNYQGYIYLPFDGSFFCLGADGAGTYETGDIMTFNQATQVYDDIKITNIEINNAWSENGAKYRSIELVFADNDFALNEDVITEDVEGSVTMNAPETPATYDKPISLLNTDGILFNIDTTAVNAPVQLRMSMISDIKKNESRWAEGAIFGGFEEVDVSTLNIDPETGLPAINPETGLPYDDLFYIPEKVMEKVLDEEGNEVLDDKGKPIEVETTKIHYPYYRGEEPDTTPGDDTGETPVFGRNTYVSLTSDEYIRTISRGYDCVMYYFDADGNAVPLTATGTTDIYAALPAGYVGQIYIPSSSFYASLTDTMQISIFDAGIMDFTSFEVEYESTGLGAVVISDIQLVMTDASIAGANVSLDNSVNLNFYVEVGDQYENVTMNLFKNNKLMSSQVPGELVEEGGNLYKFTITDIGFDEMTTVFDGILRLDGKATSVQVKGYSVAKYVAHVAGADGVDAAVSTALVDLLYFGESVQAYREKLAADAKAEANVVEDEEEVEEPTPMPTESLTDAQKALRSNNDVSGTTMVDVLEGDESEDYIWHYGDFDFAHCDSFVIDFRAFLYDEIGISAMMQDGDMTTLILNTEWGLLEGDMLFHIRYANIQLGDFDKELTCGFVWEDDPTVPEGPTYTTTLNTVLARLATSAYAGSYVRACAQNLYNLNASVAAAQAAN